MKVSELRQDRAKQAAEARRLVTLAIDEKRDNTPEETAGIDVVTRNLEAIERKIAVMERVEAVEADGERSLGRRTEPLRPGDDPLADTKHNYSLLRAYRCMMSLDRGGLETEVSQEIATRTGRPAQGLYIPWNLHNADARAVMNEQRALNITTGVGSIAAILGTDLIDFLRKKMVLAAMGATIMTDMTGGTFSLPKQNATTTGYWVADGIALTASNMTITQVTWTPKSLGAFTDLTRKFILQTNQSAEALARNDLTRMLAVEMDRAGINGSGSGSEPTGIMTNSSVTTVPMGTNGTLPTWANVVNLEKTVAAANAEFGNLGYVSSNGGRAIMKQTPKVGTTFPVYIWENDNGQGQGQINGRKAMASEQVPSNLTKGTSSGICTALIYGNWEAATYALWSGLDVLVDPYTGSSSGTVRFVAMQDLDFQLRYTEAFAKTLDVLMA